MLSRRVPVAVSTQPSYPKVDPGLPGENWQKVGWFCWRSTQPLRRHRINGRCKGHIGWVAQLWDDDDVMVGASTLSRPSAPALGQETRVGLDASATSRSSMGSSTLSALRRSTGGGRRPLRQWLPYRSRPAMPGQRRGWRASVLVISVSCRMGNTWR